MDDILRRLGVVEKDVSEIKADVSGLKEQMTHLATKTEVLELKAAVAGIQTQMPYLATKADVSDVKTLISDTRTLIRDAKTSIIQWVVGTTLAAAALAFAIAKFVH